MLKKIIVGVFVCFMIATCSHKDCPQPVDPANDTITLKDTLRPSVRSLKLKQNASNDGDAYILELLAASNFGSSLYNVAANWITLGTPTTYRYLMQYDFSGILPTDRVLSAVLYLTPRTSGATDESVPNVTHVNNNDLQICLITTAWTPSNVTWNSQPFFSTLSGKNLIFEGTAASNTKLNYDITSLVQQITGSQRNTTNNGFMFKMAHEYSVSGLFNDEAMSFCSMNYTDTSKIPYIELLLESQP